MMRLQSDEARAYALRGGKRRHQTRAWTIEGASVTSDDIAARLGVTVETALLRLKREQAKPGPVTWAGLAMSVPRGRPRRMAAS